MPNSDTPGAADAEIHAIESRASYGVSPAKVTDWPKPVAALSGMEEWGGQVRNSCGSLRERHSGYGLPTKLTASFALDVEPAFGGYRVS